MIRLTNDLAGGIVAVSTGSIYLYYAMRIRTSPLADSVGPSGVPKLLGMLMITLGLLLCVQSLYKLIRAKGTTVSEWTGIGRRTLRAAGLLLLAIAYLVIVQTLGYTVSIALLIILAALYQGATAGWRLPAIGIGGGIALWLIFDRLLGIAMPAGIF